jgi:hypothetical protein
MNIVIHERAIQKAFAKVVTLKMDIRALADDVKCNRTGGVGIEEIKNVLEGTKTELQVWQYIYDLLEKTEQ